jgi:hypothetical protein
MFPHGPQPEAVHIQIDDRRGVEGKHLAYDQPTHNGNTQGAPQFRSGAGAESQGDGAEERGHGGHHDGPEAQHASLKDRVRGALAVLALGHQGKVDHHDGILFHQPDQQHDADDGDDVEVILEDQQRQHGSDAGRGQGGDDGQRVHQALIKDAQNNVYSQQRGGYQDRLGGQGLLVGLQGAGKKSSDGRWQTHLLLHLVDLEGSVAERKARS